MKTFEFDVVTENISLENTIENLLKISGVIMVEKLDADSGNGWPTIKVTTNGSQETFAELMEIFPDSEQ